MSFFKKQFNMRAMTREALARYPQELKNTVFLSVEENTNTPFLKAYGDADSLKRFDKNRFWQDQAARLLHISHLYSSPFAYTNPKERVIVHNRDLAGDEKAYGTESLAAVRQTAVFDHELGHLVMRAGADSGIAGEIAADTYASIRTLQRHGSAGAAYNRLLSWTRAADFLRLSNTGHLTTTAIDTVMDAGGFNKLTARQTLGRANELAEKLMPSEADLLHTRHTFTRFGRIFSSLKADEKNTHFIPDDAARKEALLKQITALAETALASDNAHSFAIGARLYSPFTRPEGMTVHGTHLALPRDVALEIIEKTQERAAGFPNDALLREFSQNKADLTRPAAPAPAPATLAGKLGRMRSYFS